MKWQTNKELGPYLNHWGCFIDSILQKVEKKSGYQFKWTNEQIVEIYKHGISAGFIQEEIANPDGTPKDGCDVLDVVGVFNLGADFAGIADRAKSYHYAEHDYQPQDNETEILELKRDGYAGSHYVDGNDKANQTPWQNEIEFDPIEGGSNCARVGWIASKRIFVF
jgi:hypothetical protein